MISQLTRPGGIFSWPSLKWQKAGLYATLLCGIFLIVLSFFAFFNPKWCSGAEPILIISGISLVCLTTYTGVKTDWLNADEIPLSAKITGAISIVYGWLLIGALILGLMMTVLIIILAIILAVAFVFNLLKPRRERY